MASSRKKVILRTVDDTIHCGYLPQSGIVSAAPGGARVDLLDLEGRILAIPLDTIRSIAFVRDFNLNDKEDPERLTRRTFLARPRSEGLWLRLTLVSGDMIEGLAPLDVSLLDALLEDRGLYLTPPDVRSNTQRLFLPRAAIADIQLLAVITTPSKTKPTAQPNLPSASRDLPFPDPPPR